MTRYELDKIEKFINKNKMISFQEVMEIFGLTREQVLYMIRQSNPITETKLEPVWSEPLEVNGIPSRGRPKNLFSFIDVVLEASYRGYFNNRATKLKAGRKVSL